jgi:hypothetical protein
MRPSTDAGWEDAQLGMTARVGRGRSRHGQAQHIRCFCIRVDRRQCGRRIGAAARQGLARHQLGGGGRARRLLPGARRRDLSAPWARRDHRTGRAAGEQPHPAAGRSARLLHERVESREPRRGRARRADACGRRAVPEGPAVDHRPSRAGDRDVHRLEAGADLHLDRRAGDLFPMDEGRVRLQRRAGETLSLQPAAIPRRQAQRHAGLSDVGAVRGRKAGGLHAEDLPARGSGLQQLLDPHRNAPRPRREETRPGAALRRRLDHRLGQLSQWRQQHGECVDQAAEPGNDGRADRLLDRQDEGIRHRRIGRRDDARHRRDNRYTDAKLLRQDGARRRGQALGRSRQGLYAAVREQEGGARA